MNDRESLQKGLPRKGGVSRARFGACLVLGVFGLACIFAFAVRPSHHVTNCGVGPGGSIAHALLLALYSYAADNDGNYPDGKNSIEVCQKLMAGGYVTDPGIFYLPLPGKAKAQPGRELKPENICWDFTGGVSMKDSGSVPILFMTGYRVTYAPGAPALPKPETVPRYKIWPLTWNEWGNGEPAKRTRTDFGGIYVGYVNNSSRFMPDHPPENSIPKFVPDDFDAKGKTYRQLTPDGVGP